MATITHEYLKSIPAIYRDVLASFPELEPTRRAGYGLAYQSLNAHLEGKHSLGEIIRACEQMAGAGVVEIKNNIFVHPTPLGEQIIAALTEKELATPVSVPDFPKPPL